MYGVRFYKRWIMSTYLRLGCEISKIVSIITLDRQQHETSDFPKKKKTIEWRFNGKMSAFIFGGLILCLVINNEPFKFIVPESLCVTGMTLCAHLSHFSIFIYGNWSYVFKRLTRHRLMNIRYDDQIFSFLVQYFLGFY